MTRIEFTIPGNPFGKQRPYVFNRHGVKRKETVLHEHIIRKCWHKVYQGPELEGNVKLKVLAYYQIPKSWPKWKKKAALLNLIRPNHKGPAKADGDNVAKLVMDSLNPEKIHHKTIPGTGVYKDDGQVVKIYWEGWYSTNPRTEVIVESEPEKSKEEIKQTVRKWLPE